MHHIIFVILAYLIAAAWLLKTLVAARGLPRIPNLLLPQHNLTPDNQPTLTIIVPARDEAPHIEACLHSLLAQDYPVQILAVDDRSTDATGSLMDALAAAHPTKLTAIHIATLPEGWLGKTHALALAARQAAVLTQPDFLLFTDADVVFRPDALRRALAEAQRTRADHLVLMPTALVRRWDEAILLGTFQILGMWAIRPWRVEDPQSLRDAVGVGAFNLMRRSAYESIGGFEAQRFEIVEDLTLARRVKQAGLRQRIAFGPGLAEVHWAHGVHGILGVLAKNMFAVFRFQPIPLLFACLGLLLFCAAPPFGLFYRPTRIPAALTCAAILWAYHLYGKHSAIRTWNAIWFPLGAILFVIALLNSAIVTLRQGGVRWRGTFYPLAELRRHTAPLIPRRPPSP